MDFFPRRDIDFNGLVYNLENMALIINDKHNEEIHQKTIQNRI